MTTKRKRKRRRRAYDQQNGLCWWCSRPMRDMDGVEAHELLPDACTLEHLRTVRDPKRREPADGQTIRTVAACRERNNLRGDGRTGWKPPLPLVGRQIDRKDTL